jgi:hypothetical protein
VTLCQQMCVSGCPWISSSGGPLPPINVLITAPSAGLPSTIRWDHELFFRRSFTGRESCAKASVQLLLVDRLGKVADDPIGQGADSVNIIGVGSHENCRNRTT